jgi:hypothetical protein
VADLQLNRRWEPWAPSLGGNAELEKPFLFELACGLTRAEMRKLDDDMSRVLEQKCGAALKEHGQPKKGSDKKALTQWQEGLADKLLEAQISSAVEVLGPFIRMGSEPLTIAGKPVTGFREYLEATSVVSDQAAMMEPLTALRAANSLNGEQVLFSKRRSGGGSTTPSRSAANKGVKTGGR